MVRLTTMGSMILKIALAALAKDPELLRFSLKFVELIERRLLLL